jgi:hypothetical protein
VFAPFAPAFSEPASSICLDSWDLGHSFVMLSGAKRSRNISGSQTQKTEIPRLRSE